MKTEILIVGAGMAGLACARRLAGAGLAPVILEKSRGIGGRMATRRVELAGSELRFDHGAQYFTARTRNFADALNGPCHATALWDDGSEEPHLVGIPGMSSLPRALAEGLDIRLGTEITALWPSAQGWDLEAGPQRILARRLVLAIPAPQAARLVGKAHPFHGRLAGVAMAPCLTLMAAFPPEAPRPFIARSSKQHALAWIAQDSSKPGRARAPTTWVAQASTDWSTRHLELDPAAIADRMLPLLAEVIGAPAHTALHAVAHRWRHARVTTALGQPFLCSNDRTLYLGGDWCLGARVESAWCSGDSIGADIVAAISAP